LYEESTEEFQVSDEYMDRESRRVCLPDLSNDGQDFAVESDIEKTKHKSEDSDNDLKTTTNVR